MNARQKAKYYKKLYEALGATNINPTIIGVHNLKHYKAEFILSYLDASVLTPNVLEEYVTAKLLGEIEPVIKDSIVCERDPDIDDTRHSIDIWVR